MISTSFAGIGMTSQRTRSRLVKRLRDKGISSQRVLSVMETTPRHIFIDEALSHRAYEDTALPIGMGQTISQPYIVARMTELLVMSGTMNRVLEIGTGCGYQTSILAGVSEKVYTIERVLSLQSQAIERFNALALTNIQCKHGDGFGGWKAKSPFDAIMVTAAPKAVPQSLVEQLAVGGRMVIPVSIYCEEPNKSVTDVQQLYFIKKTKMGISSTIVEQVRFVPLVEGTI